jgi:hypothetical protein
VAKYLLTYRGGSMPETKEEQDRVMAAWNGWFEQLGSAVVDAGDPTSTGRTIHADGSVGPEGPAAASGYSIIEASSLDQAVQLAKGCPVLAGGASIDVAEILHVM